MFRALPGPPPATKPSPGPMPTGFPFVSIDRPPSPAEQDTDVLIGIAGITA